jgi:hypothetical protein
MHLLLQSTTAHLQRLSADGREAGAPPEVLTRLEWFTDFLGHRSVSETCRRFSIARTTFYRWARRFDPCDLHTLQDEPTRPVAVALQSVSAVHPLLRKAWWQRCISMLTIALLLASPGSAYSASTWNPTFLVNTEAFEIVDAGDGSSNIELRFGNATTNNRLFYELSATRFVFTQPLLIQGNLTVTGALLSAKRILSGGLLKANNFVLSGALVYSSGSSLRPTARGSSGQLIVSQGNTAPVWRSPTTSLVWFIDGRLAVTGTGGAVITMPYSFTVSTGSLRINVAPTGANVIVDVKANGASIYSVKPTVIASQRLSNQSGIFSNTSFSGGSILNVAIDQIGSSFAGSGLTIMLNGTRKY